MSAARRSHSRAVAALLTFLLATASADVAPAAGIARPERASVAASSANAEPTTSSATWFPPDSAVRSILAARVEAGQAIGLVVGLLENGETRIVTVGKSGGPGRYSAEGALNVKGFPPILFSLLAEKYGSRSRPVRS